MNIVPQDFVTLADNGVMTDSRTVARHFEKPHKNVIRDVRALVRQLPDSAKLNFELCSEISDLQNGKRQPFFRMTKDGFMLLAMGFTGAKALAVKLAFIAAFNRMAEFIRTQAAESYERYAAAVQEFVSAKTEASGHGRGLNRWRLRKPKLEMRVIQSRPHQFALALAA